MKYYYIVTDYALAWTITILYIGIFTLEFLYEQLTK